MSYREEVLNVKFAEILQKTGSISFPETIQKASTGRKLPDITIGNFLGIRIIFEAKTDDVPNAINVLENDCRKRLLDGLAPTVIGILYPSNLRSVPFNKLEDQMENTTYKVKVFSEIESPNWVDANIKDIIAILRNTYDNLISENVVNECVQVLNDSIESLVLTLKNYPAINEKIKQIISTPKGIETH